MGRRASYDWRTVEKRYVEGDDSLRELAEALGIPYPSVQRHSSAKKWVAKRKAYRESSAGNPEPAPLLDEHREEIRGELAELRGAIVRSLIARI